MLGTSGNRWMLFPGPRLPFGMVKLSPDNTDDYALDAGYEYKNKSISGFGHVHSWMTGSFITMPATGDVRITPGIRNDTVSGYRSAIDHRTETASPGYYSVLLAKYNIRAELTATTRGGFQRYTFPKTDSCHILFDLQVVEEDKPKIIEASVRRVSDTEIEGFVKRILGWNEYTLHFVARFNRPFISMGGWKGSEIVNNTDTISLSSDSDIGAFVKFRPGNDPFPGSPLLPLYPKKTHVIPKESRLVGMIEESPSPRMVHLKNLVISSSNAGGQGISQFINIIKL
jgi:putative alpha-1,2-mannosidase